MDRQRPACERGRHRATRHPPRPRGRNRRHPRDAGGARERCAGARALHQPGRDEHGRGLVPAHAPHAAPGQRNAVALSEVRGARQQSRWLHADAKGDAGRESPAVRRMAAADHVQPAPGHVPAAHLRASVSRPREPEHRSADRARGGPRGRCHAGPLRARRQERRHFPLRVLHLVQRVGPHHELLPQHHRHPDRDRPRIGDAVHVRSLAIPTNALERGGHARAQRDLSEPVEGRHPAPPGCGRGTC